MKNLLKTTSLTYILKTIPLIQDISLDFFAGEVHGILGPNGSGKSTLLKNLSGIWKHTSGSILWNGSPLPVENRQAMSRLLSLVPQNPQVHFDFLVEDIVAMGRYAYDSKYWTTSQKDLMQYALEKVDAWHLRSRRINRLSQGERQRVYIARSLVTEAPILLLDEPTSSLDIRHQIEIWELLRHLASEGKVVIVCTHEIGIVQRYCDKLSVLNQGKCVASGEFKDVMAPRLLLDVFGVEEDVAGLKK